jgi:hypothetical protein
MLRFLLDAHFAPAIVRAVQGYQPAIEITAVAEWEDGAYLHAADDVLLRAAYERGWTLVTFDQRTIRPLVRVWADEGLSHSGVIFVSSYTFAASNIGGIARSLVRLWQASYEAEWTDLVIYLTQEDHTSP